MKPEIISNLHLLPRSSHPTGLHFYQRNPHPQKEHHGDCAVRASVFALGLPYDLVFAGLCAHFKGRRTPNGGVPLVMLRNYLAQHDWTYCQVASRTLHVSHLPEECIAHIPSHYVYVLNGCIFDTWDSRGKRKKKLRGYFKPL
jgi:hypothetical protein